MNPLQMRVRSVAMRSITTPTSTPSVPLKHCSAIDGAIRITATLSALPAPPSTSTIPLTSTAEAVRCVQSPRSSSHAMRSSSENSTAVPAATLWYTFLYLHPTHVTCLPRHGDETPRQNQQEGQRDPPAVPRLEQRDGPQPAQRDAEGALGQTLVEVPVAVAEKARRDRDLIGLPRGVHRIQRHVHGAPLEPEVPRGNAVAIGGLSVPGADGLGGVGSDEQVGGERESDLGSEGAAGKGDELGGEKRDVADSHVDLLVHVLFELVPGPVGDQFARDVSRDEAVGEDGELERDAIGGHRGVADLCVDEGNALAGDARRAERGEKALHAEELEVFEEGERGVVEEEKRLGELEDHPENAGIGDGDGGRGGDEVGEETVVIAADGEGKRVAHVVDVGGERVCA